MLKKIKKLLDYINESDIRLTLLFLLFVLIADYNNIFGFFKLNFSKINVGMWNAIIIFIIFYLSYVYVDSKNNERSEQIRKNTECTKRILLKETYKDCQEVIDIINSPYFMDLVIPHVDMNSAEDDITRKLVHNPFKYDDKIIDLASQGVVTEVELIEYFKIKRLHEKVVNRSITFYDKRELVDSTMVQFQNLITEKLKN